MLEATGFALVAIAGFLATRRRAKATRLGLSHHPHETAHGD
jgi:hypothetical protein